MRVFTEQEKWILNRIATLKIQNNLHSISLFDICVIFVEKEYIKVQYSKDVKLYLFEILFNLDNYTIKEPDKINAKKEDIENKIIDTIFLLKSLKDCNLLYEITDKIDRDEFEIKRRKYDTRRHFPSKSNFDSETRKFVVKNLVKKRYFIRQEFIDFVNRGFKSLEDDRFNKSHIATWTGVSVAFIVGLVSIFMGIQSNKRTVRIDENQFKILQDSISQVNLIQNKNAITDSVLLS